MPELLSVTGNQMVGGDYALVVKCEVIGHDGGILEQLFFFLCEFINKDKVQVKKQKTKKKKENTNKQEKEEKEMKRKQWQLFPATILTSCLVNRGFTIIWPKR